jgi:formate dehydrogenase major subunit
MNPGRRLTDWPVLRQLASGDGLGLGRTAQSPASAQIRPRTDEAGEVVQSICPYCAVGCGQRVHVRDGEILQIEGDPDSPISRGRLCARGSASKEFVSGPTRQYKVRYRHPHGTDWGDLDLDEAMDMIADRVLGARERSWQDLDGHGNPLHRCLGIATLGGAVLDNEENYLIKKLFTALGAIQIENQARI